jgi:hypothetical protein
MIEFSFKRNSSSYELLNQKMTKFWFQGILRINTIGKGEVPEGTNDAVGDIGAV